MKQIMVQGSKLMDDVWLRLSGGPYDEPMHCLESAAEYRVVTMMGHQRHLTIADKNDYCVLRFRISGDCTVIETDYSPEELNKFFNTLPKFIKTFPAVLGIDITKQLTGLLTPVKDEKQERGITVTPEMRVFIRNESNWQKEPILYSALYSFNLNCCRFNPKFPRTHGALGPLTGKPIIDLSHSEFDQKFWGFLRIVHPVYFKHFQEICLTDKQIRDKIWSNGNIHSLFETAPLCELINSYLPPVKNYFEKSKWLPQVEKNNIIRNYRTLPGRQDLDNESIVTSATQLLKSFGIPESLFISCSVGSNHRDRDWSLSNQLANILSNPKCQDRKYIFFVIPTFMGRHATPVVINVPKKEIYCIDPRNNQLTYDHKGERLNSLDEARKRLREAIERTSFLRSFKLILTPSRLALQSANDQTNCGIHSVMIIAGIILTQENPKACPELIKINPLTGSGIELKDKHVDEFLVITQLAQIDFAERLTSKSVYDKPEPIIGVEEDEIIAPSLISK